MATNVGLKLKIDGEAQYRSELNNIIAQAKTLDSEMKAVTSTFTAETSAEEKAAKTSAVLAKQIDVQKQKLTAQQQMLERATEKYGEADTRTLSWRDAVNQTTATLNKMENELRGVSSGVDQAADAMNDGKTSGMTFGDMLRANITSEAIVAGVKALANAFKEVAQEIVNTAKESIAMADSINTLSTQTGLTTDQIQEFEYMTGLLDVDVSTISGSLRKLTNNMDSAASGTGAAYDAFEQLGVSVTDADGSLRNNYDVFMDVIDALGEVDNATERDAIAMDIFGRNAQELNTLVAAGSDTIREYAAEAHEMGYVMDTDTISAMVDAQDAADRLSNQFTTLKNNMVAKIAPGITSALSGVVGILSGNSTIEEFVGDMTAKIPELIQMGVDLLSALVNGIIKALPVVVPALVQAGLQLFVSLVGALPEIIKSIIAVIPQIITGVIAAITDSLPMLIAAGVDLFVSLVGALPEIIAGIVDAIPQIYNAITNAFITAAPLLVDAGIQLFVALIQNLPAIIAGIVKAVPKIITAIVNALIAGIKTIANVGVQLVQGLWQGISNSLSWIKDKITSWVGNVLNFIKNLFGISSPSKVTAGYGDMLSRGLAAGIVDGEDAINAAWRDATGGIGAVNANVTGAYGAAGAGGMIVTFNIQQRDGEDSYALAERINRQLGRIYAAV